MTTSSSTTTDLLPPKKTMPKFTLFWSCCKGSNNKDDNDDDVTEEEQTRSETTTDPTLSPKPIATTTTKKQPPVIVTSRGLDIEKFNDHQTIPDLTSLNSQEAGSPASTSTETDNNNSNSNNKFALVVHPATSPRSMDAATKALMELFKIILHIMFIDKVFPSSSSNGKTKTNDVQQEDIPDLKVNETTVEPVPVIA